MGAQDDHGVVRMTMGAQDDHGVVRMTMGGPRMTMGRLPGISACCVDYSAHFWTSGTNLASTTNRNLSFEKALEPLSRSECIRGHLFVQRCCGNAIG